MDESGNIVVSDSSALHLYLHCDGPESIGARGTAVNPFGSCAATAEELGAFNTTHPLYGGEPVSVLVSDVRYRRSSSTIDCRSCTYPLPSKAFYLLRDGLYITTPQLTFVRMALGRSQVQTALIGMDLCARYYIRLETSEIVDRSDFLVTPFQLRRFLGYVPEMRGSTKAAQALRWVAPNSGSPMESKVWLQFRTPCCYGGFDLPFDAMNYDVSAGRFARRTAQREFTIDLVCSRQRFGLEYDGEDYHQDVSNDKRRRNELDALGWRVFPIDKNVLRDPEATERSAHQIARKLGIRLRLPRTWETRYARLRRDLDLPV